MLKKTKVSLELISDNSVLEFFESQLRGGISSVFHRYAEANNKYLDSYDSTKPSSYITYLDSNNLYGFAMSKPLPTGNFKFLEAPQVLEIFTALDTITHTLLITSSASYELRRALTSAQAFLSREKKGHEERNSFSITRYRKVQ